MIAEWSWGWETAGAVAAGLAVAGVFLNNHRRRVCFILWMISNAATGLIHAYAGLWALLARDLIFLVLAVQGWRLWGRQGEAESAEPPATRTPRRNIGTIGFADGAVVKVFIGPDGTEYRMRDQAAALRDLAYTGPPVGEPPPYIVPLQIDPRRREDPPLPDQENP